MGRIIALVAGVLFAIGLLLILYLSVARLDWLKPYVESAGTRLIGRELQIAGAFQLDLLPAPSILAESITVANADWASGHMLEARHVSARVRLWSLISGPVRLESVRVEDVIVRLETNTDGRSNLPAPAPAEEPSADESPDGPTMNVNIPVVLEKAEIRDVELIIREPQTGERRIRLDRAEFATDAGERGEMQRIAVAGQLFELPVALQGELGPVEAFQSSDPLGVDLEGSFGEASLDVSGGIRGGSTLAVDVASEDLAGLLTPLGLEPPLQGPMDVKVRLSGLPDALDLASSVRVGKITGDLELRLDRSHLAAKVLLEDLSAAGAALGWADLPAAPVSLVGQADFGDERLRLREVVARLGSESDVVAQATLEGSLGSEAADVALNVEVPVLQALRQTLPSIPLETRAAIRVAPETLVLEGLQLMIGESVVDGSLRVTGGGHTAIWGRFESERLDLSPFAERPTESSDSGGHQGEQAAMAAQTAAGGERTYVFGEEPLPFELLRSTDLDIEVTVAELVRDQLEVGDVDARVKLSDALLDLRLALEGPTGGFLQSVVSLDASSDLAKLDLSLNARDLQLNLLSGKDAEPEVIPPIGLTVAVQSSGGSPRALASAADGRLLFTQGSGRIENNLVGLVSGDLLAQLFSALNPFARQEQYSNWECTIFALDVGAGNGKVTGMLAQGEKIKAVGSGSIDLDTEVINLEFNTQPRSGVGVSADMFVTPFIRVSGTLAHPGIGLNKKGVLLEGGAAVLTGGLSFIAKAAFDRAAAELDRCAVVLEEVGGHPPLEGEP